MEETSPNVGLESERDKADDGKGALRWILDAGRLRLTATVYLIIILSTATQKLFGAAPYDSGLRRLLSEVLFSASVILLASSVRRPRAAKIVAWVGAFAVGLFTLPLHLVSAKAQKLADIGNHGIRTIQPHFPLIVLFGTISVLGVAVVVFTVARIAAESGAGNRPYLGLAAIMTLSLVVESVRKAAFGSLDLLSPPPWTYRITTATGTLIYGAAIIGWLWLVARHTDRGHQRHVES